MAALVGGLGSLTGGLDTYLEALLLVASIMGGSLLWWLGLSELIATIRHRLTESRLKLINRIAGSILIAFGTVLLVSELVRRLGGACRAQRSRRRTERRVIAALDEFPLQAQADEKHALGSRVRNAGEQ